MNAPQLKKINALLKAFGRLKKYRGVRLPLKDGDAFLKLPLTGRDELSLWEPDSAGAPVYSVTATSGSCGQKLYIRHSEKCYETHLQRLVKMYRSCGMRQGDLCLNLCSYELNSGGRIMEQAFRAAGAGVIRMGPLMGPEKLQEAVRLIKTLKPNIINSYTNQIYDIFRILKRNHSVKYSILNGEPLYPWFKDRLSAVSGTRIFDHYGAMEFSGFAIADSPQDPDMRLYENGLFFEVLQDDGNICACGQGRIVVTDLENTCMPFLRYLLGDRVAIVKKKKHKYIRVLGRQEDSLLIEGKITSRRMLTETVLRLLKHPRFFLVIEKDQKNFRDILTLNIPEPDLRLTDALFKEIGERMGLAHLVIVKPHSGNVPKTSTGKHRHIIDLRPRPHAASDHPQA